jgi:hypothetical protein
VSIRRLTAEWPRLLRRSLTGNDWVSEQSREFHRKGEEATLHQRRALTPKEGEPRRVCALDTGRTWRARLSPRMGQPTTRQGISGIRPSTHNDSCGKTASPSVPLSCGNIDRLVRHLANEVAEDNRGRLSKVPRSLRVRLAPGVSVYRTDWD